MIKNKKGIKMLAKTLRYGVAILSFSIYTNLALAMTLESNTPNQTQSVAADDAKKFVMDTGNEIIQILANKKQSLSERKENFRKVLAKDFDIPQIGRFVLGKYWRQANPDQQKQFLTLFEGAIVETYSEQFNNYTDEKLNVISANSKDKDIILVNSEILHPHGGEPLNVRWQIVKKDSYFKVIDIIVNGVSMRITQRTEYAAIIQSKQKGIDGLIDYIRSNPEAVETKP